jgi:radical SAM protein with 4Fe4S-binding SPASM domain
MGDKLEPYISNPGIICLQPFTTMEFTPNGDVFTCCPPWIKFNIGNIRDNTLVEIWNSEKAKIIRNKIYTREWQAVCNPDCGYIASYKYQKKVIGFDTFDKIHILNSSLAEEIRNNKLHLDSLPTVFKFSNSIECNLSCIMCSRHSETTHKELVEKTANEVFKCLSTAKLVIMTGYGDPFVIPEMRNLLINSHGDNPELAFHLITNGLLLPKYWDKVKNKNLSFSVSVDAATKETYEKIRIGGSWENLQTSLSLLKENKNRFAIKINMTVMRCNYQEIPEFIDMAESYGFNVAFQRIHGTFGDLNIFELKDITVLEKLKSIIKQELIKKRSIDVAWGDLLEFAE